MCRSVTVIRTIDHDTLWCFSSLLPPLLFSLLMTQPQPSRETYPSWPHWITSRAQRDVTSATLKSSRSFFMTPSTYDYITQRTSLRHNHMRRPAMVLLLLVLSSPWRQRSVIITCSTQVFNQRQCFFGLTSSKSPVKRQWRHIIPRHSVPPPPPTSSAAAMTSSASPTVSSAMWRQHLQRTQTVTWWRDLHCESPTDVG